MKKLSLIMAMDQCGMVGVDDALPWHVPEELALFRAITKGGVVIMGRNTFMGLNAFPLKHRVNVVLSRKFVGVTRELVNGTHVFYAESLEVLDEALAEFAELTWFVIGGPALWDAALKTGRVNEIHHTIMSFVVPELPGSVYYDSLYDLVEAEAIGLEMIEEKEHLKFTYSHLAVEYEVCPSTFIFESKQVTKKVAVQ